MSPFDNVDTILEETERHRARGSRACSYRLEIPVHPSEDGVGRERC